MTQTEAVENQRRIPPGHRSITGLLPSRFPSGQLAFESKLEMDFLTLLQIEGGIRDVRTQPLTIDLEIDGKPRRYTPDVMVWWQPAGTYPFSAGRVVFEVKPLSVLRDGFAALAPKYRAAKTRLARDGIGFRVVTERSIRGHRLKNAELISPVMLRSPDREMMDRVRALVRQQGPKRFGDLRVHLEAQGAIRGDVLDAAYGLIGLGRLLCDLDAPINDDTELIWWADAALGEHI